MTGLMEELKNTGTTADSETYVAVQAVQQFIDWTKFRRQERRYLDRTRLRIRASKGQEEEGR